MQFTQLLHAIAARGRLPTPSDGATLHPLAAPGQGGSHHGEMKNPVHRPSFHRRGLAEAVGQAGFRKWYERELLSSHAHMVLAFLSLVAVFAALEAARGASFGHRLVNTIYVLLSAAIGAWALRRYLFLLSRAEDVANQAQCEGCGEYGQFKVVSGQGGGREAEAEVCCRRCQHHWVISTVG